LNFALFDSVRQDITVIPILIVAVEVDHLCPSADINDATLILLSVAYIDHIGITIMPGKRARASGSERLSSTPQPDSEAQRSVFAYDEIFLRIMSFLSPTDLAVVQGVSKHWARISLDPQVSRIDYKQILIPVMLNVSFQITSIAMENAISW